ncbi:hypothetical protein IZ6_23490 [Terrihabitans soli]|uniref:DUF6468 domain-containing protein n=1 Tax=Terrihabitans soli TaxID=708113 RepID=A0A6S6QMD5_9HYPH|nr:DUF6468 domain-containing protein [Terrihabitans soli]BCJ91614.1 hypothetical protein IZ6_23490 [Terrihabitans soli]
MSNGIALVIESLVAVLLVMTIGYCWLLNKRLLKLRSDESVLRATIAELVTATDIAGRAISGLKQAVHDCDTALGERLGRAEDISRHITEQTAIGEDVVRRIALLATAARPAPLKPEQPPANTQTQRSSSTLAAAQAFVRRNQERHSAA